MDDFVLKKRKLVSLWRISTLLILCLLVACRSTRQASDLTTLYNKAAGHHDEYRNPVIVIPGILGSKLVDSDSGRSVWGAFGGDAVNPKNPNDARLVSLPMAIGVPLAELRDHVNPAGVLDRLKIRLAGLPLNLQAYFHIMLTLGIGGYRDPVLQAGAIDYGEDHYTCFQFDYDWRRSNVENAQRLAAFVREKKKYVVQRLTQSLGVHDPEVKFDIIAHSMGGLVLRYFLRYGDQDLPADGTLPELTWEGARAVDKAVFIATPNAGAVDPFMDLLNGRRFALARYESAVLGTFPSMYELLPRPRHGAIRGESGEPLDFLDPAVWVSNGWGLADPEQDKTLQELLPTIDTVAKRRRIALDHLTKNLEGTQRFQAALDVPATPPFGTTLHLIAGDAHPTSSVAASQEGKMKVVDQGPGDGAVLRSSALMDERTTHQWSPQLVSPIRWSQVTFHFSNHLGIIRSPAFSDNLLYLLLEAQESVRP
jgi:pimeloyl-ACP methyl ester carboxylesterase